MNTHTLSASINRNSVKQAAVTTVWGRFINWAKAQEKDRLLWMSLILGLHGCIITPIVMLLAMMAGPGAMLWVPVIIAMAINLIPNLAAMPTKITIPIFALSILIDLGVIFASVL